MKQITVFLLFLCGSAYAQISVEQDVCSAIAENGNEVIWDCLEMVPEPDPIPDPDPDPIPPDCFLGCESEGDEFIACPQRQTEACAVGYDERQGQGGWWQYWPDSGDPHPDPDPDPHPDPDPDPTPDPDPIPDPEPPTPGEPGAYRGIPDPTDTMGYDPYADYAIDAFESGCNFSGTGTRSSPIVIDLGGARTQCGDNGVSLSGKYVILQNGSFDVTDEDGLNGGSCNFCTVRDVNFYGTQQNLGNGSVFNLGDNAVALRTEVAFFGGNTGVDRENDLHGMKACGRNKWILDAHWHHLGGDSVQVGDASRCTGENIFIGGGSFHHNRENCIDIKNSTNVVASGFECYLPNNKPDEAGVVLHDDPVNPQILDSNIYDVNTGIVMSGQTRNVVNGNNIKARMNGIVLRSVRSITVTENTIDAPNCIVNQGGVTGTVQSGCN